METVIYVDTLFFINFVIDGLCLAVSALILGRALSKWRLALGSVLGGLYSVFALWLPINNTVLQILLHLCAAIIICIAAFKWQSAAKAAANTVCFFFVSALLGGMLCAIYSLLGKYAVYNGAFYAELSAAALIAGACVAMACIALCLVKVKTKAVSKYADIKLVFRGKACILHCLCDSGNLLVCPYTALPVAVISLNAAKKLFSDAELAALGEVPVLNGVRPLPAGGIGGNALLPSFIPDEAEARAFGKSKYEKTRLCIAIRLQSNDFGGSDGIIPPCVL